jgi:hypothetical protein
MLRNAWDQVNCLSIAIGRFDANRTRFQRSQVKGNNIFTRGTGDYRNEQYRKAIYCPNMNHLPKFDRAESFDRDRQTIVRNLHCGPICSRELFVMVPGCVPAQTANSKQQSPFSANIAGA